MSYYNYYYSFQEHLDYELIQSTNPDFNKAIIRVNIFREHRQTIQVHRFFLLFAYYSHVLSFGRNVKLGV